MCDLPSVTMSTTFDEHIPDETLFLISTINPWYGDIIFYLQTQIFDQSYLILNVITFKISANPIESLEILCTVLC